MWCCVVFVSSLTKSPPTHKRGARTTLSLSAPPPSNRRRRRRLHSTTPSFSQVFPLSLITLFFELLCPPLILIEGMNGIDICSRDCFLFRFHWISVLWNGCVISVISFIAMCGHNITPLAQCSGCFLLFDDLNWSKWLKRHVLRTQKYLFS